MKTKVRWNDFPYPDKAYEYPGAKLKQHWARLHRGDCEAYPEAEALQKLVRKHPGLTPSVSLEQTAATLRDAWRAYHRGAFGEAAMLGLEIGLIGYNVANKAAAIYSTYLEADQQSKLDRLLQAAARAEELQACAETLPNAWYLHAQALGRYGQGISVAKALAEGLGGKVKASLDRAIACDKRHADAHIALGAYHAAVINKMGELIGRLTYGVSKDAAVKHFETALKLNPDSAIARIEYANGLAMLFGKDRLRQATALYKEAARGTPADAMERLDVELAKAEMADD